MRIVFLGTPDVAVSSLHRLAEAEDVEIAAVITNPDRPRGRSRRPVAPPVKVAAEEHGLQVWQPAKPAEVTEDLAALDLDAAAVVAYGALLPPAVLATTTHGFVNLHFSLLPRWRGAAPVQHAIRSGDETTGITTFVLDEGMDTGPLLDRVEVAIDAHETAGELLERLAVQGADLLLDSLRRLVAGERPSPQPSGGATVAPKVSPDDVRIDWTATTREVVDLIRSANPAPGAHTTFRGERLKVWRADPAEPGTPGTPGAEEQPGPGELIAVERHGPVVATGDGAVVLSELQPAGKAAMSGGDFVNGLRPEVGEVLGA